MKILFLDIETAPNIAHVWGLYDQNIGINQIMEAGYTMCFSAKWLGNKEVIFDSIHQNVVPDMLRNVYKLLDEADAVVHYNGTKFDIPTLNKEFLLYNLAPPSPYKQIDLLKVARNRFKFPSNKLDYVAQALGLGSKVRHTGHQLWIDCMNHNGKAWKEMEEYNKQDVLLLEKIYYKFLPWIKNHPNYSIHMDKATCPNCGSIHSHKRGFAYTHSCKYQRYQCLNCGTWYRDTKNIGLKAGEKFVTAS